MKKYNYSGNTSVVKKLTKRIEKLEKELSTVNGSVEVFDNKENKPDIMPEIGFWEKDFITNKIYYSEDYLKIFGIKNKRHDKVTEQVYSIIHPDDIKKVKTAHLNARKNKTGFEVAYRVKLKNGNQKIICEKGTNEFDSKDNLVRSIAIVQDVTSRKLSEQLFQESEERFRTFFEFNRAVMLQIDFESKKIVNCNNAAVEFYGYSKEQLLKKSIYQINTMSKKTIDELMERAVKENVQHFQFKHRLANRKVRDVEVFASLIKLEKKVNLFAIVVDVTNQVKAEKEIADYIKQLKTVQKKLEIKRKKMEELNMSLQESQKELLELNENKNKFFSIIAHDLRSPFMALSGISQMISEDMDSMSVKEVKNMASVIYNSTQNLYKLMENLLHWANIQMDTLKISPSKIDIKKISEQVVLTFQLPLNEKNITVVNNIKKTFAFADEECVKTILRNLINNAIKFSNKGSKIKLSSRIIKSKSVVKISVKDFGVGITKTTLAKIFSIKEKVSKKGTNNEIGTGLGLILSKELVEKNNGNIFVKSKVGEGSEFSFTLPLNK